MLKFQKTPKLFANNYALNDGWQRKNLEAADKTVLILITLTYQLQKCSIH